MVKDVTRKIVDLINGVALIECISILSLVIGSDGGK